MSLKKNNNDRTITKRKFFEANKKNSNGGGKDFQVLLEAVRVRRNAANTAVSSKTKQSCHFDSQDAF